MILRTVCIPAIAAALGACASPPPRAPLPPPTPLVEPPAPGPSARPAPAPDVRVVFVPEMQPLAPDVSETPPAVAGADLAGFRVAWEQVRGAAEAAATPEALAGVSLWAREQTTGARLPRGWIDELPMEPMARTAAGRPVFGQPAERSTADLPSHLPIVKRRVVVAAEYDAATRTITRVFVTIRGWVEE